MAVKTESNSYTVIFAIIMVVITVYELLSVLIAIIMRF